MILRGWYPLPIKDDVVPVSDGAGEVVEVGETVGRVAVGDRVMGTLFPSWVDGPFTAAVADQLGGSLDGMLTEYALVDAGALVAIPDHLSYEQAATLPCAAVTAFNALTGGRGLNAGETVLTLGSGGVSLFAVQLAKASGARVIATTGTAARAQRLLELGADAVIDRRATPDWPQEVRALTDGAGADHIIEVTGRLTEAVAAAGRNCEIAFVGLLADSDGGLPPLDPKQLWLSGADIRTLAVGSRMQFEAMNELVEASALTPVVDRIFGFDEAVDAYRHYEAARPFGKVVIAHG
jgi:NADPH:quinone reductase-like Zn-dependent oxidoreductase